MNGASLVAQMVKESACNAGDLGLIPGSRRSPGKGNGYPLQFSCLENPMDRIPWTVACQAPLSMDFPGKNIGSG